MFLSDAFQNRTWNGREIAVHLVEKEHDGVLGKEPVHADAGVVQRGLDGMHRQPAPWGWVVALVMETVVLLQARKKSRQNAGDAAGRLGPGPDGLGAPAQR